MDHIVQLIKDLRSGSSERINAATEELDDQLLNPENFQFLFEILKMQEDAYIQKFILISIRRFISVINKIEEQFVPPLVEMLINIIQSDQDFESRFHACKLISQLCKYQMFLDLDAIINLFLQDENLIPFTFCILEDSYLNLSDPSIYDEKLIELFKAYIQSSNPDDQKNATSFFSKYIYNVDDDSILDDPSLFEIIYRALISSIQAANPNSVRYLTNLICSFLDITFSFVKPKYSNTFIELAFECISDESIPVVIRAIVHQIFEKIDFVPDEIILQIIPISIQMSCEMCLEENLVEQDDYQFNDIFFDKVMNHDNFRDNMESFESFISLIQNVSDSDDPCFIQVSIYILDLIISSYSQFIDQINNFLIQVIQIGLNQPHESIVSITFTLINRVMKFKPYILKPTFNDIIRFFLDQDPSQYNFIFSELSFFLFYMPELPSNLEELIEFSTKSFQVHDPSVRYYSIECLKNAICFYRPQDESEFPLLHLELFMKDMENITVVFELITTLIKVYPACIKSIIPDIFALIEQSLQDNSYELFTNISSILYNLIEYFPDTMNDFVEQIQTVVSLIYDFFYNNGDNNMNDEENESDKDLLIEQRLSAIGHHLILIASTYKFYNMNEEMLMSILEELLNNESNAYANIAVKMVASKIDSDYFLSKVPLDSSTMAHIIMLRGTGNSSSEINQHILSIFLQNDAPDDDDPENPLKFDDDAFGGPPIFDNDVFILINTFLNDGQKLLEPIVEQIQKYAEAKDFVHQGWAILSLAYITHFNGNEEEIASLIQNILSIININDLSQKILLIQAINLILIYHREEIQFPAEIIGIAQEFLEDPCATTEMKNECISTILIFNSQIDPDHAQSLFSDLSLDALTDNYSLVFLESIKELATIAAQFYIADNDRFAEAIIKITFFAATSEANIWVQIKEEVRDLMKQLLSCLSEEDIISYLRQNEQKINLLKTNVSG